MEIIILNDADAVAHYGASLISKQIQSKPNSVLGLATGSTPIPIYQQLITIHQQQGLSFAGVRTFNLDEYLGLSGNHKQSYRHFMHEELFKHIDINLANTHIPNGMADDPQIEAERYDQSITALGGIDIQILGLGTNGHIGFNEPTSSLASRTRVKSLTQQTIDDNSRFFAPDEFQPRLCITMGIGTIMEAKKIIMIATGTNKSKIVKHMIEGALSAYCPATALQMHPDVCVILDEDSAQDLSLKDYYKQAHQNVIDFL